MGTALPDAILTLAPSPPAPFPLLPLAAPFPLAPFPLAPFPSRHPSSARPQARGLGAGGIPAVGRSSAIDAAADIEAIVSGTDMARDQTPWALAGP